MYYILRYDMDSIDELIEEGKNYIYAEQSNLEEIEYPGIKKGWFGTIDLIQKDYIEWPDNVEFYYSSKASSRESDYLLNVDRWLIVHRRVKETLEHENIQGLRFYNIKLIDVVTNKINTNYYFVYVENFIDIFDMEKSSYRYYEDDNLYVFTPMKTCIDADKCEGYDIFRSDKDEAAIYVSERFYEIIKKNGFSGFAFYEQLIS